MKISDVQFILTDIEGTTTSVSFVYENLFPYFRENIYRLIQMQDLPEVQEAFGQTVEIARTAEGKELSGPEDIIATLLRWSEEDKKITPLKTLQGILWQEGYQSGEIKGHVYNDVPEMLETWKSEGVGLGVFSSGSVAAQKLIFGYSEKGDLGKYFSVYFDTKTGGKREADTYSKIAAALKIAPANILFLSDIKEELIAADRVGFQTVQLVREGNTADWKYTVTSFKDIHLTKI